MPPGAAEAAPDAAVDYYMNAAASAAQGGLLSCWQVPQSLLLHASQLRRRRRRRREEEGGEEGGGEKFNQSIINELKRHAQLAVAWSAQGDLLLLLRWAAICTIVRQREEMPGHS